MALLAAVALVAVADAHGTRFDKRIDELTSRQLLGLTADALVDANRQHRAQIIADVRHIASLLWAVAQIGAFWWLWRSGNAARLRDWIRRRLRNRVAVRAWYGAALGAFAPLVGLPFLFVGYRYGFNLGLTEQTAPQWLAGYATRIVFDAVTGAAVVTVVFGLVDRLRLWYVVLMALIVATALGSVAVRAVVAPGIRAGHSERLTERAGLFARDLDTHPIPVLVAPTGVFGPTLIGTVAGYGPSARIVIGDVLLDRATPREVDFVLAQAEARVSRHAGLKLTLAGTFLFLLTAALAVLAADRVRFRRDDDALSRMALLGAYLGIVALITYPAYTWYARGVDRNATLAALHATGDRASAARLAVRRADDEMVPLCDRTPARWYFDTQPPPSDEIAVIRGERSRCQ